MVLQAQQCVAVRSAPVRHARGVIGAPVNIRLNLPFYSRVARYAVRAAEL